MKKLTNILFLGLMLSFFACHNDKNKKVEKINPDEYTEELENANKYFVTNEDDQIDEYAERYGWKMSKTGTGLRYLVYETYNGKKIEENKIVKFNYVVNLLNGMVCYDSKKIGAKEIRIGKAEIESGLEEGLQLLKKGDKAKFIIPSHLAFGWLGDSDKIPTRATLIYDVEIIDVRDFSPEIY